MRVDVFLAWRFVREGLTQSILLVAGATVGIMVVFFLTALIDAVQRTLIAQTIDVLPHVVVRAPDERARALPFPGGVAAAARVYKPAQRLRSIYDWPSALREIEQLPGVTAVSPKASGPAFASRGVATRAITLLGVDALRFARVIAIAPRVRRGHLDLQSNNAVLGCELASELGVEVGERIRISTSSDRAASFLVAGIFDLGNRDINRRWTLVSLRHGQTLLDLPGGASGLDVKVADLWQAETVARRIQAHVRLTAESWMATNEQLLIAIRSQSQSSTMIKFFIMIAVAMGIASVLIVSVVQKSRQIGILRAMGSSRSMVLRIFLLQGAAIGLLGAVFGCGLGTGLGLLFERSVKNPDGSPTYPVQLTVALYLTAALIAVVTGLLAAALPARRASRLDPATAIRHD